MENVNLDRILESIEKREVDPRGLDPLLEDLFAQDQLVDLSATFYSYISQIYYWKGEVSNSTDKLTFYQRGVDFAKKGVKKDPNCGMAHFWLGTNLGLLGQEKGILSSLFLLPEIETHLKESLKLDESYFYGAPHRAIGWLYHVLPPWPISSGDNKKAIYHLERAIALGKEFPLNYIYAGEIYLSLGKKKEAKEILTTLSQWPDDPLHQKENLPMIQKAKDLLRRL